MNKRTIIFGLITLILFLIVVLSAMYFKPAKQQSTPPPIPIFNPSITPSTNLPPRPGQLSVTNINPPEDTTIKYFPNGQISITFSEEVRPEDFFYTISPEAKIAAKVKDRLTLSLIPNVTWQDGITTITILGETKSINGNLLGKDIIYKFNTGLPENINLIEH